MSIERTPEDTLKFQQFLHRTEARTDGAPQGNGPDDDECPCACEGGCTPDNNECVCIFGTQDPCCICLIA